MPAFDELLELEQQVSTINKTLLVDQQRLKLLDKELAKAQTASDGYGNKVTHYAGLIRHMKTAADLVDLNEYSEAQTSLAAARESLAAASAALSKIEKERAAVVANLEYLAKLREQTEQAIATYGQVLEFPPAQSG